MRLNLHFPSLAEAFSPSMMTRLSLFSAFSCKYMHFISFSKLIYFTSSDSSEILAQFRTVNLLSLHRLLLSPSCSRFYAVVGSLVFVGFLFNGF